MYVNVRPAAAATPPPQERPVVGHGQLGTVGHGDDPLSLRVVEHAAKVHSAGGEVEVGEVDLGVQFHHVLMGVPQVGHPERLKEKKKGEKSRFDSPANKIKT